MANNTTTIPIKPPKMGKASWRRLVEIAGYPFPKGKEPSYEFRRRIFRQGDKSGAYDGSNG